MAFGITDFNRIVMASDFPVSEAFDTFAIHAVIRTGLAMPMAICTDLSNFVSALFCAFRFADAFTIFASVFTSEGIDPTTILAGLHNHIGAFLVVFFA